MERYLATTGLLDFEHPLLQELVRDRGWLGLDDAVRIPAVYTFVRDEIPFGYNASDDIPASVVLADGYGQCNTKTTQVMALLRAVGVQARFHGATIHKRLQQGVVQGLLYRIAPENIIHSWAEVWFEGRWVGLEGVILDGVRAKFPQVCGSFLGYGVGTDNLAQPPIEWTGTDTAIQATGVNRDYGVFDDPDTFYRAHGTNLRGLWAWLFARWIRPLMNRNVARVRDLGTSRPIRHLPLADEC